MCWLLKRFNIRQGHKVFEDGVIVGLDFCHLNSDYAEELCLRRRWRRSRKRKTGMRNDWKKDRKARRERTKKVGENEEEKWRFSLQIRLRLSVN